MNNNPGEPKPVLISVQNVSKEFGRVIALRGVSLELRQGDFGILLGRNGAGKTSLLHLIAGLTRPTAGGIMLFGQNPQNDQQRRKLAVISHEVYLYYMLTALENLEFYGQLYNVPDLERRCEEVLKLVGLYLRRYDLTQTFSRGMLQRLTIARALLTEPDLLLLDEPFTGLDHPAVVQVGEILRDLNAAGKTILLTTHDLALGMDLGNVYFVLDRKRVVETGMCSRQALERIQRTYFGVTK